MLDFMCLKEKSNWPTYQLVKSPNISTGIGLNNATSVRLQIHHKKSVKMLKH